MHCVPFELCHLLPRGFAPVLVEPNNLMHLKYLAQSCIDICTHTKYGSVSNYLFYFLQENYISRHILEFGLVSVS